MNKAKTILFIIAGVILAYVCIAFTMPLLSETAETAVVEVEKSPNVDQYIGAREGPRITPWVIYFLPGVIGVLATVIVLKRQDST
jgi:hypothetical protein